MSRFRSFVGATLFGVAALAVAAMSLAASEQQRQGSPARPHYEVVSTATTAAAGTEIVNTTAFPVDAGRGSGSTLPDSLTLVMVGSMLLGLAAAVRRTS